MHEHLLRGKAALGQLLEQLTHLGGWVGGVARLGSAAGIGVGVQPRTPTCEPTLGLSLSLGLTLSLSPLLHTHQRLGPVGGRLSEGLVAHAHDAQLELLHRAPAEGGLAWVGSGLRDRV